MKLTIVAATGGVGRQLLEQGVAAGHDVTAVARNPGRLTRQVRTVTANLAAADPVALEHAIAGADAILSGLGPHSNADAGIAAAGTRSIVATMQATGVRHIVVVSAAPVGTVASPGNPNPHKHDPGDGFFMRYLFSRVAAAMFGKVYNDLTQMEDILRDGGLDDRATTTAHRQTTDRHLPDSGRSQPPGRLFRVPCRCRPAHATRTRATRDDPPHYRHRQLGN